MCFLSRWMDIRMDVHVCHKVFEKVKRSSAFHLKKILNLQKIPNGNIKLNTNALVDNVSKLEKKHTVISIT